MPSLPASSSRTRLALSALGLAIAIALTFWLKRTAPQARPAVDAVKTVHSKAPPPTPAPSAVAVAPAEPATDPHPLSGARLRQALADYRTEAAYPPGSRPHTPGTQDKLHWNAPFIDDNPLEDGGEVTGDTFYRFGADRTHVGPGEALTTWLEAWRGERSQRLAIIIHGAWVESVQPREPAPLLTLAYRDEGRDGDVSAGDLRYTNVFIPMERPAFQTPRRVRVTADIEAGGKRTLVSRVFTYAPRPVLEILGITDSISATALVLTLDVRVLQGGLHRFEANVLDSAAAPIGYLDQAAALQAGRATVTLTFFGKMFAEHGVSGPYLIRDLRGFVPDTQTGLPLWWSDSRTHQTQPYPASRFSRADWQSPEKTKQVATFETLIQKSNRGEVAQPEAGGWIHVDENGVEHVMSPQDQTRKP